MREHDSKFESNNGNAVSEPEQYEVSVAASVKDNMDDAVVEDVENRNCEDEHQSLPCYLRSRENSIRA